MSLTPEITTDRATVYQSTWLELAATLPTNMAGASLAIVDGPYNMRKADWDTFRDWEHFREWYRPELEELTRVLSTDATVYLWGSDESEGHLRELMRSLGWSFRGSVTWDRVRSYAQVQYARLRGFPNVTESCGIWMRGAPFFSGGLAMSNVWRLAPDQFQGERLVTGRRSKLVKHQRSDWAESLHPCQKPLAFYDRLIRSSSRPGDTVLEPYGGTLRAAVACHRLPPSEARRAIVCEPHGPYIEAVRPSLEFVPVGSNGQPSLFG